MEGSLRDREHWQPGKRSFSVAPQEAGDRGSQAERCEIIAVSRRLVVDPHRQLRTQNVERYRHWRGREGVVVTRLRHRHHDVARPGHLEQAVGIDRRRASHRIGHRHPNRRRRQHLLHRGRRSPGDVGKGRDRERLRGADNRGDRRCLAREIVVSRGRRAAVGSGERVLTDREQTAAPRCLAGGVDVDRGEDGVAILERHASGIPDVGGGIAGHRRLEHGRVPRSSLEGRHREIGRRRHRGLLDLPDAIVEHDGVGHRRGFQLEELPRGERRPRMHRHRHRLGRCVARGPQQGSAHRLVVAVGDRRRVVLGGVADADRQQRRGVARHAHLEGRSSRAIGADDHDRIAKRHLRRVEIADNLCRDERVERGACERRLDIAGRRRSGVHRRQLFGSDARRHDLGLHHRVERRTDLDRIAGAGDRHRSHLRHNRRDHAGGRSAVGLPRDGGEIDAGPGRRGRDHRLRRRLARQIERYTRFGGAVDQVGESRECMDPERLPRGRGPSVVGEPVEARRRHRHKRRDLDVACKHGRRRLHAHEGGEEVG